MTSNKRIRQGILFDDCIYVIWSGFCPPLGLEPLEMKRNSYLEMGRGQEKYLNISPVQTRALQMHR